VLADRLFRSSGFGADRLEAAGHRYDLMRRDMAAGQLLDLAGAGAAGGPRARLVASLKTGSYTVEGPLEIGAILADGSGWCLTCLSRYGQPLGEAFQLLDDLRDSGADRGARERAEALVTRAKASLDPAALSPEAVGVLRMLADLILRG
jgi:geranylgeranyl pyrophosphate synthase